MEKPMDIKLKQAVQSLKDANAYLLEFLQIEANEEHGYNDDFIIECYNVVSEIKKLINKLS